MNTEKPFTIFVDIDGCLISHVGPASEIITKSQELLPGVLDQFNEWDSKGCRIILTTGRKESSRKFTENQLNSLGLFWDQLIMGLSSGRRILINDLRPDSNIPTAIAINVERNKGFHNLSIENAIEKQKTIT